MKLVINTLSVKFHTTITEAKENLLSILTSFNTFSPAQNRNKINGKTKQTKKTRTPNLRNTTNCDISSAGDMQADFLHLPRWAHSANRVETATLFREKLLPHH